MILPVGDAPNPRGFRPWVTWSILLLNTLVYLALLPTRWRPPSPDAAELPGLLEALATGTRSADPALLGEGLTAHDLVLFEHGFRTLEPSAVDLLTSLFLHADLLHLGGNLLFLWIYGDNVEHRLGRLRFVAAYLGSGAAAALCHAALAGPSALPLVGASGAISGVLGFYFVLFPANHVRLLVLLPPFFARRLLVSARLVLAAYLLFDNVLPLVVGRGVGGVAHGAHIGGFAAGALVVLLGALCYGVSNVMMKSLTADDAPWVIVFWMQIIQLPLALLPAVFYFDWVWPSWADAPWLLAMGLTGMSAHFCLARAFQLADATVCIPVDFVRLPLAAFVGWLVYTEQVSVWVLAGAILIFAGNYYSVWRETRGVER